MAKPHNPKKGAWIEDVEEGQEFIGFYLAGDIRMVPFRDPSRGRYLRLTLTDRTGSLESRIWEDAENIATRLGGSAIVKVDAVSEEFQDRLQAKIHRIRLADKGEYDLRDLHPTTKRDIASMLQTIDDAIEGIKDPNLVVLLRHFFDDPGFRERLSTAPAARRIHHAYLGGLLEHIYEVLELSSPLIRLYPEINRDLLTAGILLHDIGKLDEMSWDLDFDYTDEGRMIGHVIISTQHVAAVIEQVPDFPENLALQLEHLILAHHGRYEYGSPRRPKSLEAIALHHLENLDAQVNRFRGLIVEARRQGRNWTDYDRFLGRSLYAGEGPDLSIEERGFVD